MSDREQVTPISHKHGLRIITTSGVGTEYEPRVLINDYRVNPEQSVSEPLDVDGMKCALKRQGQTATFYAKSRPGLFGDTILGAIKLADGSAITSSHLKKSATVHMADGSKVEVDLDTSVAAAFFKEHVLNDVVRPAQALNTLGAALDKAGVVCKKNGELVSNQDLVNDLSALRALLNPFTIDNLGIKAIGDAIKR